MTVEKAYIGKHIRKLRLQQKRTQKEVADICGFTKSLLSKIETGKVVPPVATLVKIANALGTKVSSLIEKGKTNVAVFTSKADSQENMLKTEKGYYMFPFATEYQERKIQPFLFVVKKGQVKDHFLTHDGEEFLYVLEGIIKFMVDNVEYTLKAGDSLYFDAMERHRVTPVTDTAKYIDIFV